MFSGECSTSLTFFWFLLFPTGKMVRRKKKKSGSNASNFTEGWVEFREKRIAKRVALTLNNTPIGNRKKSHFAADLWSMKVYIIDSLLLLCVHAFFRPGASLCSFSVDVNDKCVGLDQGTVEQNLLSSSFMNVLVLSLL